MYQLPFKILHRFVRLLNHDTFIIMKATYIPGKHNDCLDTHITSEADWLRSLRNGYLNKSVNEKLQRYSHLRALSSKKIINPFTEINVPKDSRFDEQLISQKSSSPSDVDEGDITQVYKLLLSPVVLEDLSKPPATSEITAPELFAVNDFFDYLLSDNWSEEICLRVIGGRLLDLLIESLHNLEVKQQLISHVVHANLNDRHKSDVSEDWIYETMVVQLVFYEKAETSNFTYLIPEESNTVPESYMPVPQTRGVLRPPYSLTEHRMNNLQLPVCEDVDTQERIATLMTELAHVKSPPESSDDALLNVKQEDTNVDIITEDVSFVCDKQCAFHKRQRRISEKDRSYSWWDSGKKDPVFSPCWKEISTASNITIDTEIPIYKRLNLTRKELYVTGLYLPQVQNRISASEKLRRTKIAKQKLRAVEDKTAAGVVKDMKPNVIQKQAKHISAFRKYLHEGSGNYQRDSRKGKIDQAKFADISERLWNEYIREQEEMERDSAFKNKLERDIRIRLYKSNIPPASEKVTDVLDTIPTFKNISNKGVSDLSDKDGGMHQIKMPAVDKNANNRDNLQQEVKSTSRHNDVNNNANYDALPPRQKKTIKNSAEMTQGQIKNTKKSDELYSGQIKSTKKSGQLSPGQNKSTNNTGELFPGQSKSSKNSADPLPGHSKSSKNSADPLPGHSKSSKNSADLPSRQSKTTKTSGDIPSKFKQFTKRYFYIHAFEAPIIRQSRLPSEYERKRSSLILQHTPYRNQYEICHEAHDNTCTQLPNIYKFSSPENDRVHAKMLEGKCMYQSSFQEDDKQSVSELPHIERKTYNYECSCMECKHHSRALAYLGPDVESPFEEYPPRLGHLRRDFSFLKHNTCEYDFGDKPRKVISHFVNMDVKQVCDELMKIVDEVMFRKEMLTSSLGHTIITFTFTKRKMSQN